MPNSKTKGLQYKIISFNSKVMFNELVFKTPPLLKMLKLFRFFLEEFNLRHCIVSLQEDIIFQLKFPSKYYHSSKRLKDFMVNQNLE